MIHKAFTQRPSRFDRIWKFQNPTPEQKVEYFMKLSKYAYNQESIVELFKEDTDKFSFAAVKEVYINACLAVASKNRMPTLKELKKSVKVIINQFDSAEGGLKYSGSAAGFRKRGSSLEDDLIFDILDGLEDEELFEPGERLKSLLLQRHVGWKKLGMMNDEENV